MSSYVERISKASTIGIIDADLLTKGTRHPNLALMKISGYCKANNKRVELLYQDDAYDRISDFDLVFLSRVFTFSEVPDNLDSYENLLIGGTGFYEDGGEGLPDEIEHHMPDYALYAEYVDFSINIKGRPRSWFADYLDYSIGFLTRGCFRKCSFCVNQKYDRCRPHSPLHEFVDTSLPYVYLWDDNFFACPEWEALFDDLEKMGKPFQFRQGLDIRLLTKQKAIRLSHAKYRGDMIFAFDHIEDRDLIIKKLKLWRRYSAKGTRLYVLCAYDSQDEKDIENTFERISILMKYGCLPYIMRFESYKQSRWRSLYVQLARWCNQPQFFKKKSFRQFCEANQQYAGEGHVCSAFRIMQEFEAEYPEIAARYYDLRYEEENMFGENKYYAISLPTSCEECRSNNLSWDSIISSKDMVSLLRNYIMGQQDTKCLESFKCECTTDPETAAQFVVDSLLSVTPDFIIALLADENAYDAIGPNNIPQFSNFDDAVINTPLLLEKQTAGLTFDELGIFLNNGADKNDTARKKYGENHAKLAAALGLVSLEKDGSFIATISPVGKVFLNLSDEQKEKLLARLLFRIPIVRAILKDALTQEITVEDYMISLSESTIRRRKSNVISCLKYMRSHTSAGETLTHCLENIKELR